MIHDLTLKQKIEVAAEQIENSLDVVFSDEKKQIRLILTQFAQELVSGANTSDEPALPIQSVVQQSELLIGLLTMLEKEGGNDFIDKAEIVAKYQANL